MDGNCYYRKILYFVWYEWENTHCLRNTWRKFRKIYRYYSPVWLWQILQLLQNCKEGLKLVSERRNNLYFISVNSSEKKRVPLPYNHLDNHWCALLAHAALWKQSLKTAFTPNHKVIWSAQHKQKVTWETGFPSHPEVQRVHIASHN